MTKILLEKLYDELDLAIKEVCNEKVSVAFSGGIDSALVAFISNRYTDVELIAVGIPDSYDLKAAKSAADLVGMKLETIEIQPIEMVAEGNEMQKQLDLTNIEVEFMLPFWIAAKNATNPILMCGQGADELFGGYARFRKEQAKNNLKKEVGDLLERIPEREKKITEFFGLELACPYLEENVITIAEKFSEEERIGEVGKETLRKLALKFNLPKEIVDRKKKAAQYGSGSQKAIKKIIKHEIAFNIKFDNEEMAKAILKATEPENKGWVETTLNQNFIKATVKADTLGSLREAAEDFMACISVAEKIAKKK